MKQFAEPLSLSRVLAITGGKLVNANEGTLCKVSESHEADSQTAIFLEQDKLLAGVQASSAGLIITTENYIGHLPGKALLIVEKPYYSLMLLITYWQRLEAQRLPYQIHPSAVVAEDIRYEGEVSIAADVVIGSGCTLGKGVIIGEGCSIGDNVTLGTGTKLYPRVSVYEDCIIGRSCILHSGVVIGADGFGFMLMNDIQQKIPQVGNVVIGDDVEIGANSCIDRATLGSTVIGTGTKIDNLVQVGHNCVIGKHCILCSQVGLAGSTILGDYVYLAGQVGVAGHVKIGNRAMVGAQSGVVQEIPDDGRFFGSPAIDAGAMMRIIATQKKLPEMYKSFLKSKKESSANPSKE